MGDIELPNNYRRISIKSASDLNITIRKPFVSKQTNSLIITNLEQDVYFYMNIPFKNIKSIEVGNEHYMNINYGEDKINQDVIQPLLNNQDNNYILLIQS